MATPRPAMMLNKGPGRARVCPRLALLRGITRLFLAKAGRHGDFELELFDAVIKIVLAGVEPIARAELALRLAEERRPPPRTLLLLARDRIDVAEPILLRSPALDDVALEDLVCTLSQDHLSAIARRSRISSRISDMLVTHGNETVHLHLAANHGAALSDAALCKLVDCADMQRDLCRRLAARPDIPQEIVERLAPMIHENLDAALQALAIDVDQSGRAALFAETNAALLDTLNAARRSARPLACLTDLIERELISFDDALIELADGGRAIEIAHLLVRRTGLRMDAIMRLLFAAPEERTMLLCRAARLGVDAFSAILRMRGRRRTLRTRPADALSAYATIDPDKAARIVLISIKS